MHGSIQRVPELRQGDGERELGQHGGQVVARELLCKLLSQRGVTVSKGKIKRLSERTKERCLLNVVNVNETTKPILRHKCTLHLKSTLTGGCLHVETACRHCFHIVDTQ